MDGDTKGAKGAKPIPREEPDEKWCPELRFGEHTYAAVPGQCCDVFEMNKIKMSSITAAHHRGKPLTPGDVSSLLHMIRRY
jgi:hypothetical protein